MAKIKHKEGAEELAKAIINTYDPKTADDIQDAFKDIFGPMFEAMLKGELTDHLGFENNDHAPKDHENRRNGSSPKTLKSSMGEIPINAPRDRDGTFDPKIVPKRTTDISSIEGKVLSMYAKGMSQRDIADIIEEIYGFRISHEQVSIITDSVMDELREWQERPLKKFYTFMFIDCLYVNIRHETETVNSAVYVILAYDLSGKKDILGLWIADSESKTEWLKIFDELKSRGMEDVLFISLDGLRGLEEAANSVFPEAVIQRCIVHMVRNSVKYPSYKDRKGFCSQLKLVYKAPNKKAALLEFEKFREAWKERYPGAVAVWEKNWKHVEQLYDYTNPIRRVMYTTNAIESVNSSLRKVTKKGVFANEDAVYKALYLRILELQDKWKDATVSNWTAVRNHLFLIEKFAGRIEKYEKYEFPNLKTS